VHIHITQFLSELLSQFKHILFHTSASDIGDKAKLVTPERPVLHGHNGKFSQSLAKSGMPRNNGLNTVTDRERFMDFCKDWQDKN
jgi:hypothetical protein